MSLDYKKKEWKIFLTPKAREELWDLDKGIQKRIVNKVRFFMSSGNPIKFAKPLQNDQCGQFRFRVGVYRIIFDVRGGDKIAILKIAKQDEVYK